MGLRRGSVRRAFTLVELLVTISIIGMLAAMALGGMYRASISAKKTNTQTTINKVAVQINEIWESYRTRKLPIDPTLLLQPGNPAYSTQQYQSALGWVQYYSSIRTAGGASPIYPDPLAPPSYNGLNPNNNLQIAAIRLAALRELMRLELPSTFDDFMTPAQTNPPDPNPAANWNPVRTLLIPQPMNGNNPIANPGGLSEQYRQFFKSHATVYNEQYQNAECLYLIIKFASQNELGQKSITDDPRLVGDVDGDGMPEIQDAFAAGSFTPPQGTTPYVQHNNPISFLRWPAGYISDLQPQPVMLGPSLYNYEYAASRHDIFDPLRIDPRAVALTPLVYSAGPDGAYGLWDWEMLYTKQSAQSQLPFLNDPFWFDSNHALLGTQMDPNTPAPATGTGEFRDDITNHQLNTRE